MGFSKQEYWGGLPLTSPGDLPNPGIESRSLALQANSLPSEPPRKPSMWMCVLSRFGRVWLLATPWTVACQAPLSMGFSRQEYWSWLPFPLPGDLPDPGVKPMSFSPPALGGGFFITSTTGEAPICEYTLTNCPSENCINLCECMLSCFSHVWLKTTNVWSLYLMY